MLTQHFEVAGRHLGIATRHHIARNGLPPRSYAFVCEGCGETYAKCPIIRASAGVIETRPFQFITRRCAACGGEESLWLSWDTEFLAALPEAVLRRELSIALNLETTP